MPAERNRFRPAFLLTAMFVAAAWVPSCTVRESRADCPGTVRFDLAGVGDAWLTIRDEGGIVRRESLSGDWEAYELELPRTRIFVEVSEGASLPLEIPQGGQCPPLRVFRDTLLPDPGGSVVRVRPLRQYAELTVEGSLTARLQLDGRVCGFGADASPAEGPFCCSEQLDGGAVRFRLPRQRDASLRLTVFAGTAESAFALGRILEEIGYDWTAPELDSCRLHLELGATQLRLRSDPWTDQEEKRVVL